MIIKCRNKKINCSESAKDIFYKILSQENDVDRQKEHFWSMGLDTTNKIIYIELVSLGTLNQSIVHAREIFRMAIMKGVCSILVAHNHPCGSMEASKQDIETTKMLYDSGELLGIKLIDHIIIGNDERSFVSLRDDKWYIFTAKGTP